jgi:hypothetical protein
VGLPSLRESSVRCRRHIEAVARSIERRLIGGKAAERTVSAEVLPHLKAAVGGLNAGSRSGSSAARDCSRSTELPEREQHSATVDMLEKLAEVLEADPVEFFRRET